jgi:6-phosphogluconolactonase (cycloisomerase 2 family)
MTQLCEFVGLRRMRAAWIAYLCLGLLTACGNNSGGSGGGRVTYSVSGVISNLTADGLVLTLNGSNNLQVSATSTSFEFTSGLADGQSYAVAVLQSPASETCQPAGNATGTVSGANVVGVTISCTPTKFTLGGSITGLLGTGLILQDTVSNEKTAALAATATGYTISPGVDTGANYTITVAQQPSNPTQQCSVSNGSGQVGTVDLTTIAVSCVTSSYSLGGTVSGLAGTGLVLQEATSKQTFGPITFSGSSSATFSFAKQLLSGAAYQISVTAQPTKLNQTCAVQNNTGSGVIGSSAVDTVQVNCVTNRYGISGSIDGPAASNTVGLVLYDDINGTQAVITGTTFTFPYPNGGIPDGGSFHITMQELTDTYTNADSHCLIPNSSTGGIISGANVTAIEVTCRYLSSGFAAIGQGDSLSTPPTTGNLAFFVFDTISGAVGTDISVATSDSSPTAIVSGAGTATGGLAGSNSSAVVYVGNGGSSSVSTFDLTQFAYIHEGLIIPMLHITLAQADSTSSGSVSTLARDPTGSFLYAANADNAFISSFTIPASNSGLPGNRVDSPIAEWTNNATSLLFNSTGDYAYLFYGGTFALFSRTLTSGALTQINIDSAITAGGLTPGTTYGLHAASGAVNGDNLYVLANDNLPDPIGPEIVPGLPEVVGYSLNETASTLSLFNNSPYRVGTLADYGSALVFSQNYLFFLNESAGIVVFQVLPDGSLALAPGSPFRADGVSLITQGVVDPSGKFLYALARGTSNIIAYRINLPGIAGTAALTLIGVYPVPVNSQMVMDNSGKFIYVLGPIQAGNSEVAGFFVDPNTGILAATPGSPYQLSSSLTTFVALPPYSQ